MPQPNPKKYISVKVWHAKVGKDFTDAVTAAISGYFGDIEALVGHISMSLHDEEKDLHINISFCPANTPNGTQPTTGKFLNIYEDYSQKGEGRPPDGEVILYSLDNDLILKTFNEFQQLLVQRKLFWKLDCAFEKNANKKLNQNCASFGWNLLKIGGIDALCDSDRDYNGPKDNNLRTKYKCDTVELSWLTRWYVMPHLILNLVAAAKENELKRYPQTANFDSQISKDILFKMSPVIKRPQSSRPFPQCNYEIYTKELEFGLYQQSRKLGYVIYQHCLFIKDKNTGKEKTFPYIFNKLFPSPLHTATIHGFTEHQGFLLISWRITLLDRNVEHPQFCILIDLSKGVENAILYPRKYDNKHDHFTYISQFEMLNSKDFMVVVDCHYKNESCFYIYNKDTAQLMDSKEPLTATAVNALIPSFKNKYLPQICNENSNVSTVVNSAQKTFIVATSSIATTHSIRFYASSNGSKNNRPKNITTQFNTKSHIQLFHQSFTTGTVSSMLFPLLTNLVFEQKNVLNFELNPTLIGIGAGFMIGVGNYSARMINDAYKACILKSDPEIYSSPQHRNYWDVFFKSLLSGIFVAATIRFTTRSNNIATFSWGLIGATVSILSNNFQANEYQSVFTTTYT